MKRKLILQGIFLTTIVLFIAGRAWAQPTMIYHHPTLNIQFEAPPNWMIIPHPEDQSILEVVSIDTTIHIWVYHIITNLDGPSYIEKLAISKGLKYKGKPVKKIIKNKEVYELEANGLIKQQPIRMIITAMPIDKGIYVTQVWTPEPSFINNQQMMRNILGTLGITQ